jgi:thiamine pyrophosphokinase
VKKYFWGWVVLVHTTIEPLSHAGAEATTPIPQNIIFPITSNTFLIGEHSKFSYSAVGMETVPNFFSTTISVLF